MTWNAIVQIIERDLILGDLRYFPKLTVSHMKPNSWEKMSVSYAAQVLSRTVGLELQRVGETSLAEFVLLIDKWFDLMNTSYNQARKRAKADLRPYEPHSPLTATRLEWLDETFLPYFKQWRKRVIDRILPAGDCDRSKMLLSKSTENGLIMTTKSMTALIKDTFEAGAEFVSTRRINQDPLEGHFSQQRQRGRFCDAPNALMFGQNVRTINNLRSSTAISGSNVLLED